MYICVCHFLSFSAQLYRFLIFLYTHGWFTVYDCWAKASTQCKEGVNYFVVNHNRTYDFESERGILFAPDVTVHKTMNDPVPYDIVFHIKSGYIVAVSVVLEKVRTTYGYQDVSKVKSGSRRIALDGKMIDCFYWQLDNPIQITTGMKKIITRSKRNAFDVNGHLKQPLYLSHLESDLVVLFVSEIQKMNRYHR